MQMIQQQWWKTK